MYTCIHITYVCIYIYICIYVYVCIHIYIYLSCSRIFLGFIAGADFLNACVPSPHPSHTPNEEYSAGRSIFQKYVHVFTPKHTRLFFLIISVLKYTSRRAESSNRVHHKIEQDSDILSGDRFEFFVSATLWVLDVRMVKTSYDPRRTKHERFLEPRSPGISSSHMSLPAVGTSAGNCGQGFNAIISILIQSTMNQTTEVIPFCEIN